MEFSVNTWIKTNNVIYNTKLNKFKSFKSIIVSTVKFHYLSVIRESAALKVIILKLYIILQELYSSLNIGITL